MKSTCKDGIKFIEVSEGTVRGFDKERGHMITITARPEEMDATDYWWKETDCFDSKEEAQAFADKFDNPFWFCVIEVCIDDVETFESGTAHLGACNYESGLQFVENWDYCADMIEEARAELTE